MPLGLEGIMDVCATALAMIMFVASNLAQN